MRVTSAGGADARARDGRSVFQWALDRAALGHGAGADAVGQRRVYASGITPNATSRVSNFPDVAPRKFTSAGDLLLCVSRHQQELVGYRFKGMSACVRRDERGEVVGREATTRAAQSFWSYFAEAWTTRLSDGDDAIVKDFMLEVHDGEFIVAASATPLDGASVAAGGAIRETEEGVPLARVGASSGRRGTETQETSSGIPGAPSMQRIAFHLIRTATGEKLDTFVFRDDFMHLPRNGAVSLRGDTLAVLSIKHQRVSFLRIHQEGRFEEVNTIGEYITAEDKMAVCEQEERERAWLASHAEEAAKMRARSEELSSSGRSMLTGLTQRLVTFLYHEARTSNNVDALRLLHRNFERYVSLVMLRVRALDANLLLIKFGTPEYALARRGDNVVGPTMYAVYDLRLGAFTQTAMSMSEASGVVEAEVNAPPRGDTVWARFAGSQGEALAQSNTCCIDDDDDDVSNAVAARLFRTQDYPPQFRSLSPYFDKRLFSYDERVITAIDRLQPHVDFGIKFVSVRPAARRRVSFKLMVNNSMANSGRSKRRVQYVFHPVYPFAMSISIAYMQPTLVNFHVRSAPGDEIHGGNASVE